MAEEVEINEEDVRFHEECGKKPQFSIEEFTQVLEMDIDDIGYKETRILISKIGWLSDSERDRLKDFIGFDKLTDDEITRYQILYPNPIRFNKLFNIK